jgi:hypothetical protein
MLHGSSYSVEKPCATTRNMLSYFSNAFAQYKGDYSFDLFTFFYAVSLGKGW